MSALDRTLTRYRDALLSARHAPVNSPSSLRRQPAHPAVLGGCGAGYLRNEKTGQIRKDTVADALERWWRDAEGETL